ncbi:hypothetical protein B566_EDAN015316, partial [Ephemera danica]
MGRKLLRTSKSILSVQTIGFKWVDFTEFLLLQLSAEVKKSAPDGKVQLPSTHTNLWPVWVVLGLVVTATFIALLYVLYERLTIARQCLNQQNLTLEEAATNPLLNDQEQKILL